MHKPETQSSHPRSRQLGRQLLCLDERSSEYLFLVSVQPPDRFAHHLLLELLVLNKLLLVSLLGSVNVHELLLEPRDEAVVVCGGGPIRCVADRSDGVTNVTPSQTS